MPSCIFLWRLFVFENFPKDCVELFPHNVFNFSELLCVVNQLYFFSSSSLCINRFILRADA